MKPSLYISSKDLPEIKTWKVGDSYDLIVNVKMTGLHETPGNIEGTFEVQNAMSAEKDPMDLEDVNGMPNNNDFMKGAAVLKQDAYSK